jgi:hypothetical protein
VDDDDGMKPPEEETASSSETFADSLLHELVMPGKTMKGSLHET